MNLQPKASIGIIGGTGVEQIFKSAVEHYEVETPYGLSSSPVSIGSIAGNNVAFLARHGLKHQYPPHMVNYRANVWALKRVGVDRIIAIGAVGSLQRHFEVGDIVLCDQFVNRTWGRRDTFFDGPVTTHVSVSDPYCPQMRQAFKEVGQGLGINIRDKAILLIIQGPRFSTKAENRDWRRAGYDLVSMTHYPEVVLARELGVCYSSLCLVTDHATVLGDDEDERPISDMDYVKASFKSGHDQLMNLIAAAIPQVAQPPNCSCRQSLLGARSEAGWVPLWPEQP